MRSFFAAATGATLLAACTTTTITSQTDMKPPETYRTVTLGTVHVTDNRWAPEIEHFRHGFVERLKETKAFASAGEVSDQEAAHSGILVTGSITDIDKGNKALRFLIGMGAGRQRVEGDFQIVGPDGTTLASFHSAKAYSGGVGIGGVDFLDIDDLMEKYGAQTADAVVRWSHGQPIDDTSAR